MISLKSTQRIYKKIAMISPVLLWILALFISARAGILSEVYLGSFMVMLGYLGYIIVITNISKKNESNKADETSSSQQLPRDRYLEIFFTRAKD